MILRETSGIKFYEFPGLNRYPSVFHGFFTRHGGFSKPPYHTLNVAFKVGDNPADVAKNVKKIRKMLQGRLIWVNQDHGCKIIIIDKHYLETCNQNIPPEADAIITSEPGVALMIKVADCQAIFLFDRVKNVIANIHCGWRGNVNEIIKKTVDTMKKTFKSDPRDVIATISPSLGPCCGEFKGYRELLPAHFHGYRVGVNHFDFWKISREQLIKAGISEKNIEIAGMCTVCGNNHFFSYRKEKITGRCAAVIMLKEKE